MRYPYTKDITRHFKRELGVGSYDQIARFFSLNTIGNNHRTCVRYARHRRRSA